MKVDIYFNLIGKYEHELNFKVVCNRQGRGFNSNVSLIGGDGTLKKLDDIVNA